MLPEHGTADLFDTNQVPPERKLVLCATRLRNKDHQTLDKSLGTARIGFSFQKRFQLSSEVNVRLCIRSMYSVPDR
jgi:hypothetical protein